MAIVIDGTDIQDALPKDWAETVFRKAFEASVVGQLTPSQPMPTNGKFIPVYDGGFEVGHTAEMGRKPVSDAEMTVQGIEPKKFAGLLIVSKEAARANPGRMMEAVQADMQNAVARQIDYGIFYGRSAINGAAVPGVTSINTTTSRVEIDPTANLVPQLLDGYDLVADTADVDPSGFAFDTRFRSRMAVASQQSLSPTGEQQTLPNLALAASNVAGLPAAYGRAVAGRVGSNADTGVRGFVGDWSKLHWGFSTDIELTRSDQASVVTAEGTTIHAFQDNAIIYRVEFEAGWYVDPTAFAAYELAGGAGAGE